MCLPSLLWQRLEGFSEQGSDKGRDWMMLMLYLQKEHGPPVLLGQLSELHIHSEYPDL